MNIAFFSTLPFEQTWFDQYRSHHRLTYIDQPLTLDTARLAMGHRAVCAFVNDDLSRPVIETLNGLGVSVVGMRCVGIDNVDLITLNNLGMTLLHVPGYSPHSVAEQAVALLLGLIRHVPDAHQRVLRGDFRIDGLTGTDLHGKTVGVMGTGHIGQAFARIMQGFGCKLLAYDIQPDRSLLDRGVHYMALPELLRVADVVSLHCPLTPLTENLINDQTLSLMKPSAWLVNTGRGKLVKTRAVLDALDNNRLAGYAADVYEQERAFFHYDFSDQFIDDPLLNRLRSHPKVLLSAHQGFLTEEALRQIARSLMNQFNFYENQQTSLLSKASMC
ncbi:D-isomer specific 2-hydroxyacid dehydrogenase NAD-binding protein [Fibrella aestuarina BUZ 2]|uniref:D-isomer specific 2-hydroxyacid dehydrogenase NAD-binding protein n=1 Tax=Fibrella aestuarina BUZ 2 TaxID=1166018 RepID=I0K9U6_9BACT|nr:2-hydroxyacid dehydrogenase [Fibrella aestuarina]CCH00899.1 D-isomer specific 2-hydroxyacid dehydrogenase NAD-binding protein [Fibrella aestuarina BUZ 2]